MRMFTRLNPQGVQSDRGFVVQSVARFTVEYREGSRKISVYVEPGIAESGKYCDIIQRNAFERWDGDPDYVVLPVEKQEDVLANFIEAMQFLGMEVIVEDAE